MIICALLENFLIKKLKFAIFLKIASSFSKSISKYIYEEIHTTNKNKMFLTGELLTHGNTVTVSSWIFWTETVRFQKT